MDQDRCRLDQHLQRLYGYAYSLCRDPDDARDLVQDCAVKALKAQNSPTETPAYRAWLFRILKNTYLDLLRHRRVVETWEIDDAIFIEQNMEFSGSEDRLINTLTVKFGMELLPAVHRDILGLIDIAGLSYGEAALALEIPTGTVMSRISRARLALLKAIEKGNVRPISKANTI
ncbi:MAG: sigma-70 family RNA polymerase sigma factor [Rhodospirillales bacterium]|jgi:RNA polymerase sigma-70 factor, ECF subfamily|nr:sigma-70 family RNA polymerase sigma factor [Rhodospirillales bacterium]